MLSRNFNSQQRHKGENLNMLSGKEETVFSITVIGKFAKFKGEKEDLDSCYNTLVSLKIFPDRIFSNQPNARWRDQSVKVRVKVRVRIRTYYVGSQVSRHTFLSQGKPFFVWVQISL